MRIDDSSALAVLDKGLSLIPLVIEEYQKSALMDYLKLIEKWNRRYSLTAVKHPREMVVKHLLDALSVVPFIEPATTLDLGSGMGVPGMVLAILWPDTEILLVDSNSKKICFLQQVKLELGLKNVEILHQRIEAMPKVPQLKQVISRALASIEAIIQWSEHLWQQDIRFFMMKGKYPQDEIADISPGYQLISAQSIEVPFVEEGARHLIEIGKR